jgi:hypothetical protein
MRPKWMCGKCAHCSSNKTTTPNKGSESAAHGAVSCDFERSGNPRNSEITRKIERGRPLTFLAAALNASLCEMSGLPALMRWISSLCHRIPQGREPEKRKEEREENVRSVKHEHMNDTALPLLAITD